MVRSADATRLRILTSAYGLMRRHGFARVKMNDIAAGAALSKRTLYHHFESRDALLAAMMEGQDELAVAAFAKLVDRAGQGTKDVVEALFADLADWSATKRWEGSGFTRLAIELADLPGHPARQIARQHKTTLEHYLAECLKGDGIADASAAAREVLLLLEGAMVMILIHGDRSYASAAGNAAQLLLRNHHSTSDYG